MVFALITVFHPVHITCAGLLTGVFFAETLHLFVTDLLNVANFDTLVRDDLLRDRHAKQYASYCGCWANCGAFR